MPGWYVDVWRDAGFCWGGDWAFSKDPMHFSWMGPGSGPEAPLTPLPPAHVEAAIRIGRCHLPHRVHLGHRPISADHRRCDRQGCSGRGRRQGPSGWHGHRRGLGNDALRTMLGEPLVPSRPFDSRVGPDPVHGPRRRQRTGPRGLQRWLHRDCHRRNTRSPASRTSPRLSTGIDPNHVALAGADLDGDRKADIWEAGPGGALRVLAGPRAQHRLEKRDLARWSPGSHRGRRPRRRSQLRSCSLSIPTARGRESTS